MNLEITKTVLRRQHRKAKSPLPFKQWARKDGVALLESLRDAHPHGASYSVHKLLGVPMGEEAALHRLAIVEQQKVHKTLSGERHRASKTKKKDSQKKEKKPREEKGAKGKKTSTAE